MNTATTPPLLIATPVMAEFCIRTVRATLRKEAAPAVPASIPNDKAPIFVCFKTKDGDLRGCIGNFSPAPLHEQLKRYAYAAAFEDSRFSPMKEKELPGIVCTVNLLHSFEPATDAFDWHVGKHGIQIVFNKYRGTFLPAVADEQGWTKEETLKHLLRKAGYNGTVSEEVFRGTQVVRYQDSAAKISYDSLAF